MARIRTIKPEFWRSPDTMALDYFQRLLFIGLWNLADDEGRGVCDLAAICADLFLTEYSLNPHGVLTEASNAFKTFEKRDMVHTYFVKNRHYFQLVNWAKHQKVNRPSPSRFPSPDQAEQDIHGALTEASLNPHALLTEGSLPEQGTGNREHERGARTQSYPQPVENHSQHKTTPSSETSGATGADAPRPDWVRGTPDDPRCPQHEHLQRWDVPPCHDCAKARQWYLDQEEAIVEATKARTAQRRAAIDNCPYCDPNGMRETPTGLTRCNHKENQQ